MMLGSSQTPLPPAAPGNSKAAAPTQYGGPRSFRGGRSHFLWNAGVQSEADNCLGPRCHQPMGKGSVEPPVWALRCVDQ